MIERFKKEFKRRTNPMKIVTGENVNERIESFYSDFLHRFKEKGMPTKRYFMVRILLLR